ncbi:MAG TPA: hypothetical protein ENF21_10550 [Bacteroidetes bacterium]|nr:hypothetical protein [Bacteroidota bacterium]
MKINYNKFLTVLVFLLIASNAFTLSLLLKREDRSTDVKHSSCSPQEYYLTRSLQLEGEKHDSLVAVISLFREEAAPLADELKRQQPVMLMKMAEVTAESP